MKNLWCWRCKMEVPMLDEEEYAKATELYRAAFVPMENARSIKERFQPLLDYYNELQPWSVAHRTRKLKSIGL